MYYRIQLKVVVEVANRSLTKVKAGARGIPGESYMSSRLNSIFHGGMGSHGNIVIESCKVNI